MKIKSFKIHLLILFQLIVLAGAAFYVFSNNYQHDYHLDSGHVLVDNIYVRSLKYIPNYFIDPTTFNANRTNIDYRPVLSVTYAINYAISKYNTWSWHLFQILLHVFCVFGLFFLTKKIINLFLQDKSSRFINWTPFIASLIFAIHPYTSGVINYLSARSSLLVAAFILPSLILYLKPLSSKTYARIPVIALILYTLALFTKVEAIGALAVYFLIEVLLIAKTRLTDNEKPFYKGNFKFLNGGIIEDITKALNRNAMKRFLPFLIVSGVYFLIRLAVLPAFVGSARAASTMTPFIYLATQITAWWHYILTWFAPINLIADNGAYPIFTSFLNPKVLLAISGWLFIAYLLKRFYSKAPFYTFLTISALALISPTSTIAPLAEMVNEHRPYLPLAILSLIWILPISDFILHRFKLKSMAGLLIALAGIIYIVSLSQLTLERNLVFKTGENYWQDVVTKAPSARAYLNYGRTFMQKRQNAKAIEYYNKSLELAPNWHFTHINLGAIYEGMGDLNTALYWYTRGISSEPHSSMSRTYRANLYLKRKQYKEALVDFEQSIAQVQNKFPIYAASATAASGLGNWEKAVKYTKQCAKLDKRSAEASIIEIATPYWDNPSQYEKGILYFEGLKPTFPDAWWIKANIDILNRMIKTKTK
ncbi:tetratricopeptide repeat protein [Thermoproteota archaeon]